MKLAGHTMGTPEYTLPDAIRLFADMNLDGIEIVVQDGYGCGFANDADDKTVKEAGRLIRNAGLEVSCLTPYYFEYNSPDRQQRDRDNEGLKHVIHMASLLNCKFIRIYGGRFGDDEVDEGGVKMNALVESMRMLGDLAGKHGITLVLENHFHTMTTTAAKTLDIVRAIDHPNVGILYDQANLAFLHAEKYEEAISLQKDYIRYVHAKDLVYRPGNKVFKSEEVSHINDEDRIVHSRIIGQGIIPWESIIKKLHGFYDGWISMEYERRWSPKELPDASIGMREGAKLLRNLMGKAEEA